jgi:hypothetical protein
MYAGYTGTPGRVLVRAHAFNAAQWVAARIDIYAGKRLCVIRDRAPPMHHGLDDARAGAA